MLMKLENRPGITSPVLPWIGGAAEKAVSPTHGTSAARRARLDPDPVWPTKQCVH
jgi:hypothetical protein